MQLHVQVIEAQNPNQKIDFTSTDLFCECGIQGASPSHTKPVKDAKPKWNEEFSFPVANTSNDIFKVALKAQNLPQFLASLDVSVSSFPPGVVVDHWYPLHAKCGAQFLLHLLVQLAPVEAPPFVDQALAPLPWTPLKLHVRLVEGKEGLQCALSVGQNQQNATKWGEEFHFDIIFPYGDTFVLEAKNVGKFSIPTRYIPYCTPVDQWVALEKTECGCSGKTECGCSGKTECGCSEKTECGCSEKTECGCSEKGVHVVFHLAPPDFTPFTAATAPALPPLRLQFPHVSLCGTVDELKVKALKLWSDRYLSDNGGKRGEDWVLVSIAEQVTAFALEAPNFNEFLEKTHNYLNTPEVKEFDFLKVKFSEEPIAGYILSLFQFVMREIQDMTVFHGANARARFGPTIETKLSMVRMMYVSNAQKWHPLLLTFDSLLHGVEPEEAWKPLIEKGIAFHREELKAIIMYLGLTSILDVIHKGPQIAPNGLIEAK